MRYLSLTLRGLSDVHNEGILQLLTEGVCFLEASIMVKYYTKDEQSNEVTDMISNNYNTSQ